MLGIVTKINRKSAIVLAEDGAKQYKVSLRFLRSLIVKKCVSKYFTNRE